MKLADAKLAKDYAATDAWLVKQEKPSVQLATRRLLRNPALAKPLLRGEAL